MKTKNVLLACCFSLLMIGVSFAQNDFEKLPLEAQNFISKNYKDVKVKRVKVDDGDMKEMYTAKLANGSKLEFDQNSKITSIDGDEKIPDALVPQSILAYVTTHYPKSYITEWEIDDGGQEVELADGTELKFDAQSNFLKKD